MGPSKMATRHMLRQLGRRGFACTLLQRQNSRLVSSSVTRVIFAASKCAQQPFLLNASLLAKPTNFCGVRLYGDGAHLTKEELQTRVLNVLKLFDKVDPEKVSADSHFINDLGLDSLDVVEIVMAMEDEFAVEISDEEAEKIFTVKDCVEFLTKSLDIH